MYACHPSPAHGCWWKHVSNYFSAAMCVSWLTDAVYNEVCTTTRKTAAKTKLIGKLLSRQKKGPSKIDFFNTKI